MPANRLVHNSSDAKTSDLWFHAKVHEALSDTRPDLSDEEVRQHFISRKAQLRKK